MKKMKRRSECYIGLHFDLHAGTSYVLAGAEEEERIAKMIEEIKPDFLQCDSKGHPGVASFRTKYGAMAQFKGEEPMKVWRRVTEKYNIPLYAHYSGIFDTEYFTKTGEGAKKPDENGNLTISNDMGSFYSDYLDKKMIPQIKEIAGEYKLNGVWVDGDNWGASVDYGDEATAEFKKLTGITELPMKKGDPYFPEWLDFFRMKYKQYLKRYVDEVHKEFPDFEICSNWMFTMYAPEPVDIDLDFLSGDYSPRASVKEARSHARCIALQKKPWDLMAWGFVIPHDVLRAAIAKPAAMLKQEAAVTLALGGGVQFYYMLNSDCSLKEAFHDTFKEAVAFCRERQEYCQYSKTEAEIAILLSKKSMYNNQRQPYTPRRADIQNLDGALSCVLDAGYATDIASEHQFEENIDRYKLVIIPEWTEFEENNANLLREFVKKGGNLLIVGADTAECFSDVTGIALDEKSNGDIYFKCKDKLGCSMGTDYRFMQNKDAITFASKTECNEKTGAIALKTKYGEGNIITVSANLFSAYNIVKNSYVRDYIDSLIEILYPDPTAKVYGTHFVDISLQKKDNKTYINLVNMSGFACLNESVIYDEIPPVIDFEVKFKYPQKPKAVYMQPMNKPLEFTFENGIVTVKIDKLDIHGIIDVIE